MIRSMTGFGQGKAEGQDFKVRADIRTVNNRFLDIHLRIPQEISSLEITLKKQIQATLGRGRVDLIIALEQMRRAEFVLNRPLVSGYLAALADLKNEFGLDGTPSLELV